MKSIIEKLRQREVAPKKFAINYIPNRFSIPIHTIEDVNRSIQSTILLGFTKSGKYLLGYSMNDYYQLSIWNFNFSNRLTLFCELSLHNTLLEMDQCHIQLTESPNGDFFLLYLYNRSETNNLFIIPSPERFPDVTIGSILFQYFTLERISFIPIHSLLIKDNRYTLCIPTATIIQIVTFQLEKVEYREIKKESRYPGCKKRSLKKGISSEMNYYQEVSLDKKSQVDISPKLISSCYFDVSEFLFEQLSVRNFDFRITQQSGDRDVFLVISCDAMSGNYAFYCVIDTLEGLLYVMKEESDPRSSKEISKNLNTVFPPPRSRINFMSNENMFSGKSLDFLKHPKLPLIITSKK